MQYPTRKLYPERRLRKFGFEDYAARSSTLLLVRMPSYRRTTMLLRLFGGQLISCKASWSVQYCLHKCSVRGTRKPLVDLRTLTFQQPDASTATLRSTSNVYDTLDNILVTSKQLVTALEKADRMDRLLIMAGLVFFFLVVLFILKQRVIDRGIRIALFWTRFIPRKAKTVESVLERGDLRVTSTATSVATSVTTLAASILRYG